MVVVAGGKGTRMAGNIPKQFLPLRGKPLLFWSLECFDSIGFIDEIIVVLPKDWIAWFEESSRNLNSVKPMKMVAGGELRQDSVREGIRAVSQSAEWVGVHDAARPGVTAGLVEASFRKALEYGNAVPALPVFDTLVQSENQTVTAELDREKIFCLQTPQIFKVSILWEALEKARKAGITGTDDSGLVRRLGHRIYLVQGERRNIKITCAEDLKILEAIFT